MKLLRKLIRQMILESEIKDVSKDEIGTEEGEKAFDDAADMFQGSYKDKGGFPGLETGVGVARQFTNIVTIDQDEDGDLDAVIGYYDAGPGNKKVSASGTDGSAEGKKGWYELTKHVFSQPGYWSESSGAPAHIKINKLNVPYVDDPDLAEYLVSFEGGREVDMEWLGDDYENNMGADGWYTRSIGGKKQAKIITGDMSGYTKHKTKPLRKK